MLKCDACGFVFAMNRIIPPDLYDTAYTSEGEYAGLLASAQRQREGKQGFDWMHEWVIDRVKPFGAKHSLDLGCGVGSAAYLAQRAGWDAHGQDISQNALRVAREVFGIQTHAESIETLAQNHEFELVTAFNLIEHLPDPRSYLRTVRRMLPKGGCFGVAVPNYASYAMQNTNDPQWLPPFHLNFFTEDTLRYAFKQADLEMVEAKVKFASWSGIPGTRARRYLLAPYLILMSVIGRLRGNGIVAIARAV